MEWNRDIKDPAEKIGDNFIQFTKYDRYNMKHGSLRWETKPEIFKTYPNSPKFALIPVSNLQSNQSLISTLKERRSQRSFYKSSLTLSELSFLLWGSTGISQVAGNFKFRTAPSAGALYPIETYILINRPILSEKQEEEKEIIPIGLYHYNIEDHMLEQLKAGDFRQTIAHGALDQQMAARAPVVVIWSALFERSLWKYGQRGYRYILLDAGHIAAHFSLIATDLQLGSCQIAAIYDNEINNLIGIDGISESVIYLSVVGK